MGANLTRNEVKEELKLYLKDYADKRIQHNKTDGKDLYCCPFCGSGTRAGGDGALHIEKGKTSFYCHKCSKTGDIFSLAGEVEGLGTFSEQLDSLAKEYGYTIESTGNNFSRTQTKAQEEAKRKAEQASQEASQEEQLRANADYTNFYEEAKKHLPEAANCFRGVSLEALQASGVGFSKEWLNPEKPGKYPSRRFIFPYDKGNYLAYDIRAKKDIPEQQLKYRRLAVGKRKLFLAEILTKTINPLYVVEGEWDALSIIEAGRGKETGEALLTENSFPAVSVGGFNTYKTLLEALQEIDYKTTVPAFILAFDNDIDKETYSKARNAEKQVINELRKHNIKALSAFEEGSPYRKYFEEKNFKDANEALEADKEGFREALVLEMIEALEENRKAPETLEPAPDPEQKDSKTAQERSQEAKPEEAPQPSEPQLQSASEQMGSYLENIAARANQQELKTGFSLLDDYLNGGLHPGLYTFGAVSSLGKTALILQIADTVANPKDKDSAAAPVLIFSLEMGRDELIARSISRETFLLAANPKNLKGWKVKDAKTTSEILNQARRLYTVKELDLIDQATKNYRDGAGKNIYIIEGVGDIGSKQITETVKSFIGKTGKKPLVIIDYLQLISPADVHFSDKQNTDRAVLELKRLSRDADIPIICISSFNRESYNEPVSLASFKESGAIEYTSSVVIGLQENGLGWRDIERKGEEKEETDKARNQRIRRLREENKQKAGEGEPIEIQLEILKNRDGRKGNLLLYFYAKYNTYTARVSNQKEANAFEPTWKKKLAEEEELLENVPMALPF